MTSPQQASAYLDRIAALEIDNTTLRAEVEKLRAVLKEFDDVMNILSMRLGLTTKDIADLLNPVAVMARAALGKEKKG